MPRPCASFLSGLHWLPVVLFLSAAGAQAHQPAPLENANARMFVMPDIFSGGMVLQREKPVRVWGRDRPDRRVRVGLGNETKEDSYAGGRWAFLSGAQNSAPGRNAHEPPTCRRASPCKFIHRGLEPRSGHPAVRSFHVPSRPFPWRRRTPYFASPPARSLRQAAHARFISSTRRGCNAERSRVSAMSRLRS